MRRRRLGTKLLVTCPGCGKVRTLIRSSTFLGSYVQTKPWQIRHHKGPDGKRCPGSGTGYRRSDEDVTEVSRDGREYNGRPADGGA